jgi:hypothetical protein
MCVCTVRMCVYVCECVTCVLPTRTVSRYSNTHTYSHTHIHSHKHTHTHTHTQALLDESMTVDTADAETFYQTTVSSFFLFFFCFF